MNVQTERNITYTVTTTMVTETCCKCGMLFAMTKDFKERRLNDHGTFYCPEGHQQYYSGPSKAERLRQQLEQEKRVADARLTQEVQKRNAAESALRSVRGQNTKLKKRIGNGVCPCCSRHFVNVERHIKTKHPDFAGKEQLAERG